MTNASAVAGIDSGLLRYYSRLREHRCRITEGIRVIAFRNMDHLTTATEKTGVRRLSDEASYISVQNKMLEDQALEQSHTNRWLLGHATWVPWEIYMCLLYAEIENYMAISQKHTSLVYKPIEDYLASNHDVVQSLRGVRDRLLHPLKETNYDKSLLDFMDRANRIAPDYRIAIVQAQHIIDDYLEWLRESFIESVSEEAVALSNEQLLESIRKNVEGLTGLQEKSVDDEEKKAIAQSLKEELELRDFLVQNFDPGPALAATQRQQLVKWEARRDILVQPLPKRPYYSSPDSIQTSVHKELSSFLPNPGEQEQLPWTGEALPEFLRQRRSEYIGLLFRSLILLNEPYTNTIAVFDSKFPGKSRAEVWGSEDLRRSFLRQVAPLETAEDYTRTELHMSPHIVSLALLAEPLRLYKQATSDRHELRREVIEQRISGDSLAPFLRMRNVVFHVPDDRTDFFKAELDFFDKASSLGEDYREVIGSLLSFYLPDPAHIGAPALAIQRETPEDGHLNDGG